MPTSRQRQQIDVEIALDSDDLLGEGPVWRQQTQELLRVDVARGLVHAWHPQTGRIVTQSVDGEAGAALPCQGRTLVVAVDRQLRLISEDGSVRMLARVEEDRPENRLNDCRSDPQGRIWAGTMSKQRTPGAAGLYRLSPDGALALVIEGTTLSNGIGWSPDGAFMYFIDSTTQRIDVLDFDGSDGSIANRRAFAEIAPADGLPDGLTVDAEGGVWVCLFGGGAIRRYGADGTLEQHVALPVPHPTCPTFGGEDLSTLFITTTRHKLSPTQLDTFTLAGSVLSLTPGVRGMKANLAGIGGSTQRSA
jgi:sugar lactone lactonase YvrE